MNILELKPLIQPPFLNLLDFNDDVTVVPLSDTLIDNKHARLVVVGTNVERLLTLKTKGVLADVTRCFIEYFELNEGARTNIAIRIQRKKVGVHGKHYFEYTVQMVNVSQSSTPAPVTLNAHPVAITPTIPDPHAKAMSWWQSTVCGLHAAYSKRLSCESECGMYPESHQAFRNELHSDIQSNKDKFDILTEGDKRNVENNIPTEYAWLRMATRN